MTPRDRDVRTATESVFANQVTVAIVATIAAGVAQRQYIEGELPWKVVVYLDPEEVARLSWGIYDEILRIQAARLAAAREAKP